MDEFSELEGRVEAFCIRIRALLDELDDLAPAQRRLCESVAEIQEGFDAIRLLRQTNGQL